MLYFITKRNKKEEGTWKNNKWVGDYKYYYENGEIERIGITMKTANEQVFRNIFMKTVN